MNYSKTKQAKQWVKWYESGAVPSNHPETLYLDAMCEHGNFKGILANKKVLSCLKSEHKINQYSYFVVTGKVKLKMFSMIRIPKNAITVKNFLRLYNEKEEI